MVMILIEEIAGKVMSKWVSAQPTKDKPPLGLRHSQSEVAANTPATLPSRLWSAS